MQDTGSSFIFPAFNDDYADHPGQYVPGFGVKFAELLEASGNVDPALWDFSFSGETYAGDELRTQYLTYIYSCAGALALRQNGHNPSITAGYSMGIYAALFDAGVFTFGTGLEIIRFAYHFMTESLKDREFSMATLIGLSREDITLLIGSENLAAEITNRNASHSFVVSGTRKDITRLLELAREDGALHARDLGVSVPYHAEVLREGAVRFGESIADIPLANPVLPLISLVDQSLLDTADAVRSEMVRNLYTPLNWFVTIQALLDHGVTQMTECGTSRGLVKNSKFVKGDYRLVPLDFGYRR